VPVQSPADVVYGGRPVGQSVPHVETLLDRDELDTLRLPPGLADWRGLDSPRNDGYMPPHRAAEAMRTTVEEVEAMVNRGWLSARQVGSSVWVRPAAVTRR
jgi:hypothetical protein